MSSEYNERALKEMKRENEGEKEGEKEREKEREKEGEKEERMGWCFDTYAYRHVYSWQVISIGLGDEIISFAQDDKKFVATEKKKEMKVRKTK